MAERGQLHIWYEALGSWIVLRQQVTSGGGFCSQWTNCEKLSVTQVKKLCTAAICFHSRVGPFWAIVSSWICPYHHKFLSFIPFSFRMKIIRWAWCPKSAPYFTWWCWWCGWCYCCVWCWYWYWRAPTEYHWPCPLPPSQSRIWLCTPQGRRFHPIEDQGWNVDGEVMTMLKSTGCPEKSHIDGEIRSRALNFG